MSSATAFHDPGDGLFAEASNIAVRWHTERAIFANTGCRTIGRYGTSSADEAVLADRRLYRRRRQDHRVRLIRGLTSHGEAKQGPAEPSAIRDPDGSWVP